MSPLNNGIEWAAAVLAPPAHVVPGLIAVEHALLSADGSDLRVDHAEVYPHGVTLVLTARANLGAAADAASLERQRAFQALIFHRSPNDFMAEDPDGLHITVSCGTRSGSWPSDGRDADTTFRVWPLAQDAVGGLCQLKLWISPRPAGADLTVTARVQALTPTPGSLCLDADVLDAAVGNAIELWPEPEAPDGHRLVGSV